MGNAPPFQRTNWRSVELSESERDADAARQYMAAHLRGSLERYKVLLRSRTAAE